MNAPAAAATPNPVAFNRAAAQQGVRELRDATWLGLLGQLLIWASAAALWVFGSLFSSVPTQTTLAYGASGITVTASEIFGANVFLVGGALVSLYFLIRCGRGFRSVGKAYPRHNYDGVSGLAICGAIGFALFALGWAIWLGSFVAPGSNSPAVPGYYTPVLAGNLSNLVGVLLVLGGLLAFLGMLGVALGASNVGVTFEVSTVEFGGILSAVPALSIVGTSLLISGLSGLDRKLGEGWIPPPPPPPLTPMFYPGGYPGGPPIVAYPGTPSPPSSWDSLAVALVVTVLLLWLVVIPFAAVLALESGLTKGPSSGPGGVAPSAGASSPVGSNGFLPLVLVVIVATGLLLPIAVVRNRRKRERALRPPQPPPPPPPPPPPLANADPLDHLV